MKPTTIISGKTKRIFDWIWISCLLLIIPIKALRWIERDLSLVNSIIIGVAPSLLGPAGLLFLVASSSGPRLKHFTLFQTTLLVGFVALGFEFVQKIPRHGILANIHYTFDWFDVVATLFSISVGYLVARLLILYK